MEFPDDLLGPGPEGTYPEAVSTAGKCDAESEGVPATGGIASNGGSGRRLRANTSIRAVGDYAADALMEMSHPNPLVTK